MGALPGATVRLHVKILGVFIDTFKEFAKTKQTFLLFERGRFSKWHSFSSHGHALPL